MKTMISHFVFPRFPNFSLFPKTCFFPKKDRPEGRLCIAWICGANQETCFTSPIAARFRASFFASFFSIAASHFATALSFSIP